MNLDALKCAATRAFVGAVAVAGLAGCAAMSPGAAAVVEGRTITMETADETAAAYCAITVLSQEGAKVDSGDMRRQAVADLVTHRVAKLVAADRNVEADPKAYDLTREQKMQITETFPALDPQQVVDAVQGAQQTIALMVALGEDEVGEQITAQNERQIRQAGRAVVGDAMQSMEIAIDDRFGLSDTTAQLSATGSLSVAVGKEPSAASPVTTRCM